MRPTGPGDFAGCADGCICARAVRRRVIALATIQPYVDRGARPAMVLRDRGVAGMLECSQLVRLRATTGIGRVVFFWYAA